MSDLSDIDEIRSHLKRAVKEQLHSKIEEVINEHDASCNCCGPTDIGASADAVCTLVVQYILEENEH